MKKIVICIMVSFAITSYAQEQKGIKFTRGMSWAQIKEKAKTENRYIFVDTYTTWCLPCKVMEKEIFPQAAVGEFFNENFINVAVQLDVTKKDNEEVKRWYQDAKYLEKTYNIKSFPTYLFFSPDGELVHKIEGASPTGTEFINKAKKALDPSTQLETLKKQYAAGQKDPEFLLRMIKVSRPPMYEPFTKQLINEYLKTQENLLTEQNIKYILDATTKSTDPGFKILQNHADKIDALARTGASSELIKTIAFDEVAIPLLRVGGSKQYLSGGMIRYEGDLNKSVDWVELEKKYEAAYPSLVEELMVRSKCEYYNWMGDWPAFTKWVDHYIAKYPEKIHSDRLKAYSREVLSSCSEPEAIQAAIKWSEKNILDSSRKNAAHLYTYGALLYKSGQKEPAIKIMEEAAKLSGDPGDGFAKVIAQINKGDKLWIK